MKGGWPYEGPSAVALASSQFQVGVHRQTAPPSPAEKSPGEEGSTIVWLVWLTTTSVVRTEIPPVRSPLFSKGEISESERT